MKTISLEQEINPWEAQAARFDLAAQKLNLDEGLWKILRYPTREIIVHIPVQMDDGRLEVFTGFRVQHSIARGPAKGGVRYSPDLSLDPDLSELLLEDRDDLVDLRLPLQPPFGHPPLEIARQ